MTTVRDVEIFAALSDEQRRAAGRIAIDAARETFAAKGDRQDIGSKYRRIAVFAFWGDDCDPDDRIGTFPDRLRRAGFPL